MTSPTLLITVWVVALCTVAPITTHTGEVPFGEYLNAYTPSYRCTTTATSQPYDQRAVTHEAVRQGEVSQVMQRAIVKTIVRDRSCTGTAKQH